MPEREKIWYCKKFASLFQEYLKDRRFKNASKMTVFLKVVHKMFTEKAHSKTPKKSVGLYRYYCGIERGGAAKLVSPPQSLYTFCNLSGVVNENCM